MSSAEFHDVSWPQALKLVRAAVNDKKGEWEEICKRANVGYHWLRRFAEGISKSPDAHRVGRVAVVLGLPIRFSIPRSPIARTPEAGKAHAARA